MRKFTTWKDLCQPGLATDFFARESLPRFDPTVKGYDWQNAWWLAELCRLAYRQDREESKHPAQPTRSAFLAQAGLRQEAFFNDTRTSTQVMLVRSVGSTPFAVLVFRGTEQDPRDFIKDIKLPLVSFGPDCGKVHEGFREALNSVWEPIAEAISKLEIPLFFTGHSLGAALATLAAACHPPSALYTFGSPLVGDSAFGRKLSKVPVFRMVDGIDAVTEVPSEALGYCHVGELHRLTGETVSPEFLQHPLDWFRALLGSSQLLADHAPINYVERLESSAVTTSGQPGMFS